MSNRTLPLYELDPGAAYAAYEATRERAYQAMIQDAQCKDCRNCSLPGIDYFTKKPMFTDPDVAWCHWDEDFTHASDYVVEIECDHFEER